LIYCKNIFHFDKGKSNFLKCAFCFTKCDSSPKKSLVFLIELGKYINISHRVISVSTIVQFDQFLVQKYIDDIL